jgi:hypothetical protein
MIKFKTEIGDFEIPSNLQDLTVGKLQLLRANIENPVVVWSQLTGLPIHEVAILDLDPLENHLDFLKDKALEQVEPLGFIKIKGEIYNLPEDIGHCQFGQKILSSMAVQEGDVLEILAIYLQPIYHGGRFDTDRTDEIKEMFSEMSVEDVYSCIKFLSLQLEELLKWDKEMLKPEITPEQKLAGIDMFDDLGYFNTINMLSGGDVTKNEDVLKMDYYTIRNKLLHIKISAKFDKRYSAIINKGK